MLQDNTDFIGYVRVPEPIAANDAASKGYVDNLVFRGTYDCYLSPTGDDAAVGDAAHPWLTPARAIQEIKKYTRFASGSIFRIYLTGGASFAWDSLNDVYIEAGATLALIGVGDTALASGALAAGTTNPDPNAFPRLVDALLVTAGGFGINTYQGKTLLVTSGAGAGIRLRIREHTDNTFIPCNYFYRRGYTLSPGDTFQIVQPANTLAYGNNTAFKHVGSLPDGPYSDFPGVFWLVNVRQGGVILYIENSRINTVGCEDVATNYYTACFGGKYIPGNALFDRPIYSERKALQLGAPADGPFSIYTNIKWADWLSTVGTVFSYGAEVAISGVVYSVYSYYSIGTVHFGVGILTRLAVVGEYALIDTDYVFGRFVIAGGAATAWEPVVCSVLLVTGGRLRISNGLVFANQSGAGVYATGIDSKIIHNGTAGAKPTGTCAAYSIRLADGACCQTIVPWVVTGGTADVLIDDVPFSNAEINAMGVYIGSKGSKWIQGGG